MLVKFLLNYFICIRWFPDVCVSLHGFDFKGFARPAKMSLSASICLVYLAYVSFAAYFFQLFD